MWLDTYSELRHKCKQILTQYFLPSECRWSFLSLPHLVQVLPKIPGDLYSSRALHCAHPYCSDGTCQFEPTKRATDVHVHAWYALSVRSHRVVIWPTLGFGLFRKQGTQLTSNSRTDKHIGADIHRLQSALTQLQHYWSRRSKTWVRPVVICAQTQRENVLVSFALLRLANNISINEQETRIQIWGNSSRRVMRTHTTCKKPENKSQCVADARWAMRNKLQWEWRWTLTDWKTSCVRAEVARHKKKLVACH